MGLFLLQFPILYIQTLGWWLSQTLALQVVVFIIYHFFFII